MRVDFTNVGLEAEQAKTGRAGKTGTAAGAASANSGAGATSASVDQTSFSFDQTRVQTLASQALAAPEVRQEKVAPLQQAVASGDYQVDPTKVAEAIAAEAGDGSFR